MKFDITIFAAKRKFVLGAWAGLLLVIPADAAEHLETLPQTKPLDWEESDLSSRLMDGAHRFIERKIAESVAKRSQFWARDFSSPAAYARSVQPNRARFQTIIGVVDPRLPARMERFGDDAHPALVAETPRYRVYQVRWPVLDGLFGSGLLVQPKGSPVACMVAVPDADQTPEQLMGLASGVRQESQVARLLAENRFEIVLPTLMRREKLQTADKQLRNSDQTHREWIYRQAFHLGRHVIGYEVQTVMAAVDWFRQQHGDDLKVGVCGQGEGGLIAFYAAAADPRIDAALVSGYFDSRQKVWAEHADREAVRHSRRHRVAADPSRGQDSEAAPKGGLPVPHFEVESLYEQQRDREEFVGAAAGRSIFVGHRAGD